MMSEFFIVQMPFFLFFGLSTLLDEKEQPMYSHIMQTKFFELMINNNWQCDENMYSFEF